MCVFFASYEKSETHRFEVPRMLVDDPEQLEQYISKSKDKYDFPLILFHYHAQKLQVTR